MLLCGAPEVVGSVESVVFGLDLFAFEDYSIVSLELIEFEFVSFTSARLLRL